MLLAFSNAVAIAIAVVALVSIAALGALILKGYRRFMAAAERSLSRAFEGTTPCSARAPGLVEVVFHTYCGLLAFTHQREHRFWATPEDARRILARLHRFNLTWGLLARGALLIPFFSLGNYWAQRSRIASQESSLPA